MIEIICLILLGVTLAMMCSLMFHNGKISKRFGGKVLFFIAALFVVFSLAFKPESFIRWDLIEHFKLLENMRLGGMRYVTTKSQYADLYVYNFFAYFISLLPQKYQNLLTAIPLIIDFAIVGYIYKRMFNEHLPDTNGKTRVLAIMLWLFTFGIKLAISGIRCSLAVSIVALAVYLEFIQKKKKALSIFLYVIATFIHHFAIVAIFARLLTAIKKPVVVMLLALGISSALEPIAHFVIENVDNEYLVFSFKRVLDTIEEMGFSNAINQYDSIALIVYMCFIALSVYLFVIATRARRAHKENGYCRNVANFAATVGAVAIGLSFNYLYLERFMYFVSFALLMITPIHNNSKNGINIENLIVVPMALFVFFFNDIYIFMVNYVGSYFLAF